MGQVAWTGTGFFVSADGKIITNQHVVAHTQHLRVKLQDGRAYEVPWVLSLDKQADVAVLKVDGGVFPYLALGCANVAEIGDVVFSLSNPLGLLQNTLSEGLISGIRSIDGQEVLQVSAPISHGSSGGPLLNRRGEVIGITAATISAGQNLNFAVPIRFACRMLSSAAQPKSLASVYGPENPVESVRPAMTPPATGSPAPPAEAAGKALDNRWFTAGPKTVLADPRFQELPIWDRESFLAQIDPKFAKMPTRQKDLYLWRAETEFLPKPPIPSRVLTWASDAPGCAAQLSYGKMTKTIEAEGLRVEANFYAGFGFWESHIRVVNQSPKSVAVAPKTFFVTVRRPKQLILRFEYPSRVNHECTRDFLKAWYPGLNNFCSTIESSALKTTELGSNGAVDGDVYFESTGRVQGVVLRVFLGDSAFDIPFTLQK